LPEHPKFASADHDIHELIRQRWSPRAFDPSKSVPRQELLRLFEAARWAPSSRNEQPWRFLVLDRRDAPTEWRRLFETLSTANQAWAAAAPLLVLSAVRTLFEDSGVQNQMSWYDAGQAVAFLTLQATSQGLSLRQMEGFDRDRARAACGVPAEFEPAAVIAIGYAGNPEKLTVEKYRSAETKPRQRRPLGDFVYETSWGTSVAGRPSLGDP
jgi:nitroreductase